jgi:acyl-CoA synthetase (AMP-forming)/AMP-acid ligase II
MKEVTRAGSATGVPAAGRSGDISLDPPGLLDWLAEPASDTGIYVALPESGWMFTSYVELAERARSWAATLAADVVPGSRVCVLTGDTAEFGAAFIGCLLAGCTPAPIATPTVFAQRERYIGHLRLILSAVDPAALIVDSSLQAEAEDVMSAVDAKPRLLFSPCSESPALEEVRQPPPELALLQFTSGSTGQPKGVRIPWRALEANLAAIHRWLDWRDGDAVATWLPLYHDMGLIGTLLTPLTAQRSTWQVPPIEFIRDPCRWLECFGEGRATISASPTFGYAYAARRVRPAALERLDFSGWRVAIVGAERVTPDSLGRFTAALAPRGFSPTAFAPAYGLAEATLAVTGVPADERASILRIDRTPTYSGAAVNVLERGLVGDRVEGTGWMCACGPPLTGMHAEVVDETGAVLEELRMGELRIRGTSLSDGYHRSAEVIERSQPEGLATGDAAFMCDGQVFVIGRIGDSVSVRGRNIFAEDIDTVLELEAGIARGRVATVFGATHAGLYAGVLVEDDRVDPDLIVAVLTNAIGPEVRRVVFRGGRGSIQRTSSGKPKRKAMFMAMAGDELVAERLFDSERP